MAVASFICLFIQIQHLKVERKTQEHGKPMNRIFFGYILLNPCALWEGTICFGRPYSPAFLYSCGIFTMTIAYRRKLKLRRMDRNIIRDLIGIKPSRIGYVFSRYGVVTV
jgi:hypothetical protein